MGSTDGDKWRLVAGAAGAGKWGCVLDRARERVDLGTAICRTCRRRIDRPDDLHVHEESIQGMPLTTTRISYYHLVCAPRVN